MKEKTTVVVMYGGRSTEHEVSLRSAAFVLKNLDRQKYNVQAIGIAKDGTWFPQEMNRLMPQIQTSVPVVPTGEYETTASREAYALARRLLPALGASSLPGGDLVVFPVLHGTYGEDGCLQGLLDMAEVAYVGPDRTGSAIAMDKDIAKQLVERAGVPVVPWVTVRKHMWVEDPKAALAMIPTSLAFPLFVKPASLGSSVGITKVKNRDELSQAFATAFAVDDKLLVEQGMNVREIEFAALGGYDPALTTAGEVVAKKDFYSYEAKYQDAAAADVLVPAPLDEGKVREGQEIAGRIYRALGLHGLSRIDLFLTKDTGRYYFNEANTLPGFTSISQFPLLWQHAGLSPSVILDRLIEAALLRHRERKELQRSH